LPAQCPSCGLSVTPESSFCYACGANLQPGPAPASWSPGVPPSGESKQSGAGDLLPALVSDQPYESTPPAVLAVTESPQPLLPPPQPAAAQPFEQALAQPSAGMCLQHAAVPAVIRCALCGNGVCATCDCVAPAPGNSNSMLQLGQNMHLCPSCASSRGRGAFGYTAPGRPAPQQTVVPLGAGIVCSRHPEIAAVRYCRLCSTPMCQTCDFELPGYFHICPGCATNPKREMGSGRKRNLIIGYALAVWTTVAMAAIFAGALAGTVKTKEDQEMVGIAMALLVFFPALAGAALSVSTIDRKLGTPPVVWGAVIWNSVIVGVWLILIVIGNLK
jgi:hypothetical protein